MTVKSYIKISVILIILVFIISYLSGFVEYYNERGNNQATYIDKTRDFEKAINSAIKNIIKAVN